MKSLFVLSFIILCFNVEAVPHSVNGEGNPMILLPSTSTNTLSVNRTGTPAIGGILPSKLGSIIYSGNNQPLILISTK
jgi:hypothetical protein